MEVGANGQHTHQISGGPPVQVANPPDHAHDLQGSTDKAGLDGGTLNVGPPLTFIDDLQIAFDGNLAIGGKDITPSIHTLLGVAKLGDTTMSPDPFVTDGVEIDLLQLGVDLKEGHHFFIFSVKAGGGQIHYNLYID
jgi:hypothetical protein